jgi:hypothetical protein
MMEFKNSKIKAHHIGIVTIITAVSGYYGVVKNPEVFQTHREAEAQDKRIDEVATKVKSINDLVIGIDEKVSRVEGILESQFGKKKEDSDNMLVDKSLDKEPKLGG